MQFNQLDWLVITTYALACLQSTQVSLRLSIQKIDKDWALQSTSSCFGPFLLYTSDGWIQDTDKQCYEWTAVTTCMSVIWNISAATIMGFYSYISNLGYLLFCRRQHFSSLDDERCNNLFVKFNSCKLQQLQRLSKWCQISVRSLRTSICYIMPYNMHVISRDRILGECFFCSLCSYRPNLIYEHELEGKKGFCSAYKWLF